MEELFSYLLLLIYPASAFFFTHVTHKLFRVSKAKLIPVFLIAPSVAGILSMMINVFLVKEDNSLTETIMAVVLGMTVLLILQIALMAVYD